jgi:outer membrane protein
MKFLPDAAFSALAISCMLLSATALAEEYLPNRIKGDMGGAIYGSTSPVRGSSAAPIAVPYFYFDYGRFFSRFDTFGIKTLPLGYGYLEIVGRINLDGYKTNNSILRGINERKNSLPLGIGTFQETPIGGFFLNAYYDANPSHGRLYEVLYAAELHTGNSVVYPMLGFEHFSAQYTRYFYGVSPTEAASSIYPVYTPAATTTPKLGMVWEVPVANDWNASLYMLRKWPGPAISNSPLLSQKIQDVAFISLSYRYK